MKRFPGLIRGLAVFVVLTMPLASVSIAGTPTGTNTPGASVQLSAPETGWSGLKYPFLVDSRQAWNTVANCTTSWLPGPTGCYQLQYQASSADSAKTISVTSEAIDFPIEVVSTTKTSQHPSSGRTSTGFNTKTNRPERNGDFRVSNSARAHPILLDDAPETLTYDGSLSNKERVGSKNTLTAQLVSFTFPHVCSFFDAGSLPDGTAVSFACPKVVVAPFGCFTDGSEYVSEPDGTTGARLVGIFGPSLFDQILFSGVQSTDAATGERVILLVSTAVEAHGNELVPTGMANSYFSGTCRFVKLWGRVIDKTIDHFTIDDGSGAPTRVRLDGLAVPLTSIPSVGSYVSAVGIATVGPGRVPSLRLRYQADIHSLDSNSQQTTVLLYPGENRVSLPRIPLNPDPAAVFGGTSLIDGKLTRLDAVSGQTSTYSSASTSTFGNLVIGEGYKINVTDGLPHLISYQGIGVLSDGSSDASGKFWFDHEMPLPNAGTFWFGPPFEHPVPLDKVFINTGPAVVTLPDAAAAGWISSQVTGWDPATQQEFVVDPNGPSDVNQLLPGRMYKITTYIQGLALRFRGEAIWKDPISGNWSDSTKWVAGRAPLPTDVVYVDKPGDYTVTVDSNRSATSLTVGDGSIAGMEKVFVGAGNSLTLQKDAVIAENAELAVDDGHMSVARDAIVAGAMRVTAAGSTVGNVNITGDLITTGQGSIEVTYKGVPQNAPVSAGGCLYPTGTLKVFLDPLFTITSPTSLPLMQATKGIIGDFPMANRTYPSLQGFSWGTEQRWEGTSTSSAERYYVNAAVIKDLADSSALPDGTLISMTGTVYASGGSLGQGVFYVLRSDRIAGMRVESADSPGLSPGDQVELIGKLDKTPDNERMLKASQVKKTVTGPPPTPMLLGNRSIGGAAKGGNPGVTGAAVGSIYNVGLYVAAVGKVTNGAGGQFSLDDGSGVLVLVKSSGTSPPDGSIVKVQGPCGLTNDAGANLPTIRIVDPQRDIRVY